jgi:hypothetical protein
VAFFVFHRQVRKTFGPAERRSREIRAEPLSSGFNQPAYAGRSPKSQIHSPKSDGVRIAPTPFVATQGRATQMLVPRLRREIAARRESSASLRVMPRQGVFDVRREGRFVVVTATSTGDNLAFGAML